MRLAESRMQLNKEIPVLPEAEKKEDLDTVKLNLTLPIIVNCSMDWIDFGLVYWMKPTICSLYILLMNDFIHFIISFIHHHYTLENTRKVRLFNCSLFSRSWLSKPWLIKYVNPTQ